ncbi:MAG: hypothetical protein K0Q87_2837, partial [Neobacillus sp.]|nr:hypothetical protein [Neobacillus sp.]
LLNRTFAVLGGLSIESGSVEGELYN